MTQTESQLKLVIFDFDEKQVVRAYPPVIRLTAGQRISLEYKGRLPGTFFFPQKDVFGQRLLEMKGEGPFTLELQSFKTATPGDYPYSLYLPDVHQMAEGESPPRMIIDPPGK